MSDTIKVVSREYRCWYDPDDNIWIVSEYTLTNSGLSGWKTFPLSENEFTEEMTDSMANDFVGKFQSLPPSVRESFKQKIEAL